MTELIYVTQRHVRERLRQRLRRDGLRLLNANRNTNNKPDLYVASATMILRRGIELDSFAREMGVLQPFERVQQ